jgi:hypothetical protein
VNLVNVAGFNLSSFGDLGQISEDFDTHLSFNLELEIATINFQDPCRMKRPLELVVILRSFFQGADFLPIPQSSNLKLELWHVFFKSKASEHAVLLNTVFSGVASLPLNNRMLGRHREQWDPHVTRGEIIHLISEEFGSHILETCHDLGLGG